jgi:hypothetical protein
MAWIKRNLFFVVGGVLAFALLGGAGYYIWSQYSRNQAASDKLTEIYGKLSSIAQQQPGPGKTNTETAKIQDAQLRAWINSGVNYFQTIPGIPSGTNVSSKDFGLALGRTVDQLQHAAEAGGISLPPKYGFSFSKQLSAMTFAPGSLDQLAQQLGEVKAITDIFFATRLNSFESVQRVRISEDDAQGSAADYLDEHPLTNSLAIVTPYVVTFRCFSADLSRVLAGLTAASNTFIVKSVNVVPAGAAGAMPVNAMPGMGGEGAVPAYPQPLRPEGYNPYQTAVPAAAPPAGKGALQIVLKEQLLRVVTELELVKLLPKS